MSLFLNIFVKLCLSYFCQTLVVKTKFSHIRLGMKKILNFTTASFIASLVISVLLSSKSLAYLSLNESAEILPENYFNIGIAPQTYLSNGGGFDLSVFADAHLFENTDGRLTIGSGDTDFWAQGSLKWAPYPDVDDQPAMGFRGALGYSRKANENSVQLQISPIISKKSTTATYNMLPYIGFPITLVSEKNNSYVASQLSLGALWFPWDTAHIGAEFNLNLKNSISSASVYLMFPFEGATGYKKY